MKNVIPYTKEIIFKSNIGEICSISLEHEEEVVGNSIEGIFKVSGEYKTHEISVNKEDFSYDLPFNIELDEDIDKATINVDIEDFNYSFASDVLKVNIEFSVTGERKQEEVVEEIEEEKIEEQSNEEERNEVVFDETILEKINEIEKKEKEIKEEIKEEKKEEVKEEIKVETKEETKEVGEVEEKNSEELEYITYHVHIIKEEETVESICKIYNASESLVSEYNDLTNIKIGDKLIIPEVQDE